MTPLAVLALIILVLPAPSLASAHPGSDVASGPSSAYLIDSPTIPFPPNSPPYAFNGAYANYTLTYYTDQGPYVYISDFIVSNVDSRSQTFSVRAVYNSYLSAFGSLNNATFQEPIPFPAASPQQLQDFKQGQAPYVYSGDNVTSGVLVTVPAGTFVTYRLEALVSTVWFDASTGVLVKEQGLMLGQGEGFVGLVLEATNIRLGAANPGPTELVVTLSAAAVVTIALVVMRHRDGRPVVVPSEPPVSTSGEASSDAKPSS